jgi:type II secretory ATPase GspE/PulE/Tfp pilus assembly ATPase PilB-like protein
MTIQLNNKRKSSGINLQSVSNNSVFHVKRAKEDLDKHFTETEAQAKAKNIGLPYINLYGFPIETSKLYLLPKETLLKTKMGLFAVKGSCYYLCTNEYGYYKQKEYLDSLKTQKIDYKVFLCSSMSMEKLHKTYDKFSDTPIIDDTINFEILPDEIFTLSLLQKILDKFSTASDILETLLKAAIYNKASDIHFEPEENVYTIRFRLDGVLHTFAKIPKTLQKAIETRIKILTKVKLNVDNVPQDGRYSFVSNDTQIDVRTSFLPSNYGYSIVMRLLGTGTIELDLEQLGFADYAKEQIEWAISKPQGLILTTGPTGSGKTTTLYSFLKTLNDGANKIITLEDPIEYQVAGISQTQIDTKAGYTFHDGLRSILRQDPDVVMVGEIRDPETAAVAIQASLTGHQVLSTIHTNDAAGAIPRLMEMGLKGFLLADSLAVILGQRLVRKLCTHCQIRYKPTEKEKTLIIENLTKIHSSAKHHIPKTLVFKTAKGCSKCNNLGYKGRIGCYEVLQMNDTMRELLNTPNPSIVQVRNEATKSGMVTMLQDGILKCLSGQTDIKEIIANIN